LHKIVTLSNHEPEIIDFSTLVSEDATATAQTGTTANAGGAKKKKEEKKVELPVGHELGI
jgi:hypothetical protein